MVQIVFFLMLILLSNFGVAIGWGIQFQQPIFLLIIAIILSIFSLNLLNIFEIPIPRFVNSKFFNLTNKNGYTRDFFSGFFVLLKVIL